MKEQQVNTVTITYKDKPVTAEQVADGVYRRAGRKGAKTYLVRCCVTGEMCYCSDERLDKLIERHGTVEAVGEKYTSRAGKRQVKEQLEAATEAVEQAKKPVKTVDEPTEAELDEIDVSDSDVDAIIDDVEIDESEIDDVLAEIETLD